MNTRSFFRLGKKKETLSLVFDIGSASVGAALTLLSTEKPPKILYAVRENIRIDKKTNVKLFIKKFEETLRVVIEEVQREGMSRLRFTSHGTKTIDNVHCIFASPWQSSRVYRVALSESTPFRVTPEFLDDILQEEMRKDNDKEKSSVLIEKKITSLKINGYEVSLPHKQKGTKVDVLFYTSFLLTDVKTIVEEHIIRSFNIRKIDLHSLTLSFFSIMRDTWSDEENFLFVDVSGEVTNISLVKNGGLYETTSFPLGRNSFIRSISGELSVSLDEASTFMGMYFSGTGDEKVVKKIEKVLEGIREKLQNNFQKSLLFLSQGIFLPHLVFLAAATNYSNEIEKILKDLMVSHEDATLPAAGAGTPARHLPATPRQARLAWRAGRKADVLGSGVAGGFMQEPLIINTLIPKTLSQFVTFDEKVYRDTFLVLDVMFIDKVHHLK